MNDDRFGLKMKYARNSIRNGLRHWLSVGFWMRSRHGLRKRSRHGLRKRMRSSHGKRERVCFRMRSRHRHRVGE